jgi:hypothetical protein
MLFLSGSSLRLSPQFHYGIEPAVGLFWALASAPCSGLARRLEPRLPLWLLFWALASLGRSEPYWIRAHAPSDHARWVRTTLIPCVDPAVALAAPDAMVPHLATRPWASHLPLRPPPGPACIITDSAGSGLSHWPMDDRSTQALPGELLGQGWNSVYRCGGTEIFAGPGAPVTCLICAPPCPNGL